MTSTTRLVLSSQLRPHEATPCTHCRAVQPEDVTGLAQLMLAAYRGTIDDDGETLEDAQREIHKAFAGEYGRLLPSCSFVIQEKDALRSACLVSWYEPTQTPLVVFLMTHPDAKRKGCARTLLQTSMRALWSQGHTKLTLIVTKGNDPALALYQSLGFVEETAS